MTTKTNHWTWIMLVAVGCAADPSLGEPASAAEHDIAEIVENLERAGYPAAEIDVEDDGRVFVGGDAHVTLAASREMIGRADRQGELRESAGERFRQYRTNNLVSSAVTLICVDGSALTGTLSDALDAAITTYDELDLSFGMKRRALGADPDCDAEVAVTVVSGSGGSAGFPSGGLPFSSVEIGEDIADFGLGVATHVIIHELGHCVGLRHTDYFNRSISCGTGGNEGQGGVGAIHIPNTPTGASFDGSVMNSCFNAGSTGQFAQDDVVALLELYEATPPLPPVESCEGRCGSYDPALPCQCDDACEDNGNCCEDEALHCGPPPPPPEPNSCAGSCGGNAGTCWCDTLCFLFGDCCDDFAAQC